MTIKDGFLLRKLGDTCVVVPVGQAAIDLRGMISLNETGAFLWEQLQSEQSEDSLTQALTQTYEVQEERARADVKRFLELLNTHGLLKD